MSISAQARKAADSSGANQAAKQAQSANAAPKQRQGEASSQDTPNGEIPSFNRDVSRDYSVDSGQVVGNVIDK